MQSASAFWLLVVLFVTLLAGCSSSRRGTRDASAQASAGPAGVQVEQAGAAAVPAKATRNASHVATWIPAGVEVTAWLDGRVTWKTTEPVPFTQQVTLETATGPQSFTPPAAPSPADEADGRARWLGWIGLFVGVALVFVGFKGWPMVGTGGAGVAGASVAVLALSAVPRFVWGIGGAGLILAVLGFALWHLWLKNRASNEGGKINTPSAPA